MSAALVRPTSLRLAEGQLTHLERTEVDIALAQSQWDAYCDALAAWGFEPVRVPGDADLPDQVFVEDAVVVFDSPVGRLAVITSPGAESRRGETDAVAETLRDARRRAHPHRPAGDPRRRGRAQGRPHGLRGQGRPHQRGGHPSAARDC
ncbi:MAG: hypothetical protein R2717_00330 [Schumannella sp.]